MYNQTQKFVSIDWIVGFFQADGGFEILWNPDRRMSTLMPQVTFSQSSKNRDLLDIVQRTLIGEYGLLATLGPLRPCEYVFRKPPSNAQKAMISL